MTVTANTTRNDYLAGNNQNVYNYTFQLNDAADVTVILNGVIQTLNVHYTVQNVGVGTGGTITFTLVDSNNDPIFPTQGQQINILMTMELDRDTSYQPNGAFLASDVNNDYDRLWLAENQQQTAINRSLRLQDKDATSGSMELPLKASRLNRMLAFDSVTGEPIAGPDVTSVTEGATLSATLINGNTTNGNDVIFNDNDKAKFGTGSDLEIYHDGNNSVIKDSGTGILKYTSNNSTFAGVVFEIENTDPTNVSGSFIHFKDSYGVTPSKIGSYAGAFYILNNADERMLTTTYSGAVELYHSDDIKLSTTTSGVDVTGAITVSGNVDGRNVSTDGIKLDGIEALADVTDATNVTAAGALMDSEVTNLAQVKAFDSSDYATAAQGTTADNALPKSGGTLTGDLNFGNNIKINLGNSDDLQLYHDGSNSIIKDSGSGVLRYTSNSSSAAGVVFEIENTDTDAASGSFIHFKDSMGLDPCKIGAVGSSFFVMSPTNEYMIKANSNSDVELYYNNLKKLETTSTGIDVTGEITADGGTLTGDLNFGDTDKAIFGNSNDLSVFHDHTYLSNTGASFIEENGTGNLIIKGSNIEIRSSTNELYAQLVQDGVVQLACDNEVKLSTTGSGINVTGEVKGDSLDIDGDADISGDLNFGASDKAIFNNNFEIYRDASNSIITETGAGSLILRGTNLSLQSDDNDQYIQCVENGAVTLYYQSGGNSAPKVSTTNSGIDVTGTVKFDGLEGTNSVNVTQVLDEDNMASNSATSLSTQQSIKSYVDTAIAGGPQGDITAVTAGINLSGGGTTGAVTLDLDNNISLQNITLTGYLRGPSNFTIDPAAHGDDTGTLVVAGNLQVDGTTTTINSTTVEIADLNFKVAKDATSNAEANTGGFTVGGSNAELKYLSSGDKWTMNKTLSFADSLKTTYGDNGDLEIYHDGNNSIIKDSGDGILRYTSNNSTSQGVVFEVENTDNTNVSGSFIHFKDSLGITPAKIGAVANEMYLMRGSNNDRILATNNSAVELYHSDAKKFETYADGIEISGNAKFPVNGKAIFNDNFEIYRDASNSIISETGAGSLILRGTNLSLQSDDNDQYLQAIENGGVTLYHQSGGNSAPKLATTSTGVDVTGTATMDGLVVNAGTNKVVLANNFATTGNTDSPKLAFYSFGDVATYPVSGPSIKKVNISSYGAGDLVIYQHGPYDYTHEAEALRINWSGNVNIPNGSLMVGSTTAPDRLLSLKHASQAEIGFKTGSVSNGALIYYNDSENQLLLRAQESSDSIAFQTGGGGSPYERLRIDASGNVGINTSNPQEDLQVGAGASSKHGQILISADNGLHQYLRFTNGGSTESHYPSGIWYDPGGRMELRAASGATTSNAAQLVLDSSGNVGIGCSPSAAYKMQVAVATNTVSTGSPAAGSIFAVSGGTTTVGDGVSLQLSNFSGAKESAWRISSVTTSGNNGDLVFNGYAGGSDYPERMRIDSSGNLFVGCTALPSGGGGGAGFEAGQSGGRTILQLGTTVTSSEAVARFYNPNGAVGNITLTGSTCQFNSPSDQRLKENIADADDAGSKIDAIQVRKFDWKADGSHQDYGMIAQELQLVAPEAVSGDADSEDMMGVDYSKLVPMLIKEIQSLRNRVAQLEE